MRKIKIQISAEVLEGYQHLIAAFENTIFKNLSRSNRLNEFIAWDLVNTLVQFYNVKHFTSKDDYFTLFRSKTLGKSFIGKKFGFVWSEAVTNYDYDSFEHTRGLWPIIPEASTHADYDGLKHTKEFLEIVPTFNSESSELSLILKTPREVVWDLSRTHSDVVFTKRHQKRVATEYILSAKYPDFEEMQELFKNTAINPNYMFDRLIKDAYVAGVIDVSPKDIAMLFSIWSRASKVFFETKGSLPKFWEKALVRAYKDGINYAKNYGFNDVWPIGSLVAKFLFRNLFNDGIISSFCRGTRVYEIKTMDNRYADCITWVTDSPKIKSSTRVMVYDIYSLLTRKRNSSLDYVDKRYSAETFSNIDKSDKELDREEEYPEDDFKMTDKEVRLILHKFF